MMLKINKLLKNIDKFIILLINDNFSFLSLELLLK